MNKSAKNRARLNRTVNLSTSEKKILKKELIQLNDIASLNDITNRVINQDLYSALKYLPEKFVDLLFIDPPYNLSKNFNGLNFKKMKLAEYEEWIESWLTGLLKVLKKDASIYFCCDWQSSTSAAKVLSKFFTIRNRITWEREKGRGAKTNWKNSSEDIWFCTVSDKYKFNVNNVKLRRNIIAPYKIDGKPKDWNESDGVKFRDTFPSNIWTDITIPFWSMPENTDHPTQKPEKLLAKIILAGSDQGDVVFDPFMGSGTTAVTAQKLNRKFCGIEINEDYCCLAVKRLKAALSDTSIQGYNDGVFWERNSFKNQKQKAETQKITPPPFIE
ncbi:MAG: site-specific DNA-methyltransferase [Ignavibacterium sp.]|nr:site-specific DNA-methyltransferase [Ignavibacterium sp.]